MNNPGLQAVDGTDDRVDHVDSIRGRRWDMTGRERIALTRFAKSQG